MSIALVFTGHMIDLPDRNAPRFPSSSEDEARAAIGAELDRFKAGDVVGFASGARGGDILFHEECRRRGIPTVIVLPFQPAQFIKTSVEGAEDGDWSRRFSALWSQTPEASRLALDLPVSDEAYAQCNERLLDLARARGSIHLIALWDGKGGDGPGGTADMISQARKSGDEPHIISPKEL